MLKRVFAWLMLLGGATALGSEDIRLDRVDVDLRDKASLQRGAKTYMNYCMGCHTLKYQRYERTADDLGIPHELFLENLVFDRDVAIGSLMDNSMSEEIAKNWFGAKPPDLTLITRVRHDGPSWLYTYLRSFYQDDTRPFGVNNLIFENVGMPHALLELQGMQVKGCRQVPRIASVGGEMRDPITKQLHTEEMCGDELIERGYRPLTIVEGTGSLTEEEYDRVVRDLVNFLYYTGEPSRLERQRIGVYVLLFLAFFFVFAYLLNREYWKDVN